ncbi:MAG: iron-containing alcohol dehydrogenase [bacterium]|nr:iron-containing alcohol dehydrogenase [bacterium]
MKFKFIAPEKIIFGEKTADSVAKEVKKFGKKVCLITGKTAMARSGILNNVRNSLENANLEVISYNNVIPEPTTKMVDEGLSLVKTTECDVVIGLGGGSALDVAKAVAGLANEDGGAVEYQEGREIKKQGLPFIAIPTTAGTGAEATYNAVIINEEKKVKQSIRDYSLMARVAIVDPTLTLTLSPNITAISGMDTLVHLIEGYVSNCANPLTDALAVAGLKLVGSSLKKAVEDGQDKKSRADMSLASLHGGLVLANAGLGAVHGLASPLGPLYNIPHGLVCAILLPYVMEYNLETSIPKFAQIAYSLDIQTTNLSVEGAAFESVVLVEELISSLNLPFNLISLGVQERDLPIIVQEVSSSLRYNPKEATFKDLINILKNAMTGE